MAFFPILRSAAPLLDFPSAKSGVRAPYTYKVSCHGTSHNLSSTRICSSIFGSAISPVAISSLQISSGRSTQPLRATTTEAPPVVQRCKQALISVSDKQDLTFLGSGLQSLGYTIVSTGGTASVLENVGISVTKVDKSTNFLELFEGINKTLRPSMHGGIFTRQDHGHHMQVFNNPDIGTFDVVVMNLHPSIPKASSPTNDITFEDAVKNIDINGVTLIRAAVKNRKNVLVVVDHSDYRAVLEFLKEKQDNQQFRSKLSWKAHLHANYYCSMVFPYVELP